MMGESDIEQRLAAAYAHVLRKSVQELLSDLDSADKRTRSDAILALGWRQEVAGVARLIESLQDDANGGALGSTAAWALGAIGDRAAVPALISALDSPYVAGNAIEALQKLRDERAVEPLIRYFERTHIPSVATVLGRWGDRRAVPALILAMEDYDPHVRYYAARALGRIGDARALPVLAYAALHDLMPMTDTKSVYGKSVAYAAERAIQMIFTQQAEAALQKGRADAMEGDG